MLSQYQPPALETLKQEISLIEKNSTSAHTHLIRLLSIVAKLDDENAQNIIIGTAVYITEKTAPKSMLASGSRLQKDVINKVLQLTRNNPLNDKERLYYLNQFYQYAKKAKLTLAEQETKDPGALDKAITPITDIIEQRLSSEIQKMVKQRPTVSTLTKSLQQLTTEYKQTVENREITFTSSLLAWTPFVGVYAKTDPKHIEYAAFLSCFNDKSFLNSVDIEDDTLNHQNFTLPYAALLYVTKQIENQYFVSPTGRYSPENSLLYRMCKKALNISHSNDLYDIETLFYLSDLRKFIKQIATNKEAIKILNDHGVKDPINFLKQVRVDIHTQLTSESFLKSVTKNLVLYASLYVSGFVFLELATKGYYVLGIGRGLGTFIGTHVGAQCLGPWGSYIGARFGKQVEPEIAINGLQTGLRMAYGWFKYWAYGDPYYHFDDVEARDAFDKQITKELKIDFMHKLSDEEMRQIKFEQAWLQALSELPSSGLSAATKEKVTEMVCTEEVKAAPVRAKM